MDKNIKDIGYILIDNMYRKNDQNKAKQIGTRGREFVVKTFSWDIIAKNFIDVTKQTL